MDVKKLKKGTRLLVRLKRMMLADTSWRAAEFQSVAEDGRVHVVLLAGTVRGKPACVDARDVKLGGTGRRAIAARPPIGADRG
jgi:hypothetical protein